MSSSSAPQRAKMSSTIFVRPGRNITDICYLLPGTPSMTLADWMDLSRVVTKSGSAECRALSPTLPANQSAMAGMPSPLTADTRNTASSGASRSVWASNRFSTVTARTLDPCRFIRQVNEFGRLERRGLLKKDPCRFIRQVNQFARLKRGAALAW